MSDTLQVDGNGITRITSGLSYGNTHSVVSVGRHFNEGWQCTVSLVFAGGLPANLSAGLHVSGGGTEYIFGFEITAPSDHLHVTAFAGDVEMGSDIGTPGIDTQIECTFRFTGGGTFQFLVGGLPVATFPGETFSADLIANVVLLINEADPDVRCHVRYIEFIAL